MSAFRFGDDYRLNFDESHQGDDYLPSWDEIDWSKVDWVEIEGEKFEKQHTCQMIVYDGVPACSECKGEMDYNANYCEWCGAKVVSE